MIFNPFKNLPASQDFHSSPAIRRYKGNPILTAKDVPYPADYVFNAGVAFFQGEYLIAPRVDCHNKKYQPGMPRNAYLGVLQPRRGDEGV